MGGANTSARFLADEAQCFIRHDGIVDAAMIAPAT
jgi:hypothetical protein